jgi:hypothetical protein
VQGGEGGRSVICYDVEEAHFGQQPLAQPALVHTHLHGRGGGGEGKVGESRSVNKLGGVLQRQLSLGMAMMTGVQTTQGSSCTCCSSQLPHWSTVSNQPHPGVMLFC